MASVTYKGVPLEVADDISFSHSVVTQTDKNVKWVDIMLNTDKSKLLVNDVWVEEDDLNNYDFGSFAKENNLISFASDSEAVKHFADIATPEQQITVFHKMVNDGITDIEAIEELGYVVKLESPSKNQKRYFFPTDEEKAEKSIRERFNDFVRKHKDPEERYNDVFNEMSALNSVINMNYQINNGGLDWYFGNEYDQEADQRNPQDVIQFDKDHQVETLKSLANFGQESSLISSDEKEKIIKVADFIDSVKKINYDDLDWGEKEEIIKNAFDEHADWYEDAVLSGDYRDMFQDDYYLGDDLRDKLENDVFVNNKYELAGDDVEEEYEKYKEEWCDEHDVAVDEIDEDIGVDGYCYMLFDEWCNEQANNSPNNLDEDGKTFEEKFGDDFDSIDDIDDTTVYHYDGDILEEESTYTDVLDPDGFAEDVVANGEEYNWDIDDYYLYIDDDLVTSKYDFMTFEKDYDEIYKKIEMLFEAKAQYLVKANQLDEIQYINEKTGLDKLAEMQVEAKTCQPERCEGKKKEEVL